jgi:hypothetical protein
MTYFPRALLPGALVVILAPMAALAAPGEDPVTITGRVTYLQLPTAPVTRSGSVQYRKDIPDDVAAKISRYTAKAYSPNLGQIKTEKDVVQSVQTNGTQTTCTQSVGSVSAPGGSGIQTTNNDQVVVLRGDLINICN